MAIKTLVVVCIFRAKCLLNNCTEIYWEWWAEYMKWKFKYIFEEECVCSPFLAKFDTVVYYAVIHITCANKSHHLMSNICSVVWCKHLLAENNYFRRELHNYLSNVFKTSHPAKYFFRYVPTPLITIQFYFKFRSTHSYLCFRFVSLGSGIHTHKLYVWLIFATHYVLCAV